MIQNRLGRTDNSRPQKHNFAFRGLIRCGECGSMITGEQHFKKLKTSAKVLHFVHYKCTKKDRSCSQKAYLNEKDLKDQIQLILQSIYYPKEFVEFTMAILKRLYKEELNSVDELKVNNKKNLDLITTKLDNLLDLRLINGISEEEYIEKKQKLEKEKLEIDAIIEDSEIQRVNWAKIAEEIFDFASTAKDMFIDKKETTQRSIFASLGSNPTIKERKLKIDLHKPLEVIRNCSSEVIEFLRKFEPQLKSCEISIPEDLIRNSSIMGRWWVSNPQPPVPQTGALPLSYIHH